MSDTIIDIDKKGVQLLDFEKDGYTMYQTNYNELGFTENWQKRLDTLPRYKDLPLCELNDKTHINIESHYVEIQDKKLISYTFSIVQESNDIWCDLKFYGLKEETVLKYGVDEFEARLAELWKHNYFLHHTI